MVWAGVDSSIDEWAGVYIQISNGWIVLSLVSVDGVGWCGWVDR